MFLKDARQLATDVRLIGFAILSEAHEIERGKKFHLHSLLLQVGRQHVRADYFALRKNLLAHLLCIFLRTHGVQEREAVVEEVGNPLPYLAGVIQFGNVRYVLVPELVDDDVRSFGISLLEI